MKEAFVLLALIPLLGCDFTTPLSPAPREPFDARLLGAWERKSAEGGAQHLLILPLDERSGLVVFPAQTKDAIFARVWSCPAVTGLPLYQLQWIGSSQGAPETNRVFQLAAVSNDAFALEIKMVNPAALGADLAAPASLARALATQKDNPALFREPMRFRKSTPAKQVR